jgi:glycosyltransferase involved in cell wall biosynthesis
MRIALFTETFLPKIDGIVTRLRFTIAELQRQGDEVLVFAPGEGIPEYAGAQIVRLPGVQFPLYRELTISFPRPFIRQRLLDFKPDVIHAADPACLGVAGVYYSDVLRLPLVVSYHTRLPKYLHYYGLGRCEPAVWKLMRVRHNKADLNLCTSEAMVDELQFHGIERVRLWPPAVDTEVFHPRFASCKARAELSGGHPEAPLLVYVGRISPEKNIEQIRTALEAIPEARLAIVGGGPHENQLRKHFAGVGVFFAGYRTGLALAEAMASSDVLILPSKTETLGLVLIEAMASKCIVAGANSGGIPNIIQDGVTGLLFNPDEPGALVGAIQRAISDPDMPALRERARAQTQQWSWENSTCQLKQYYSTAIQMPRRVKPIAQPAWKLMMKKAVIGGIKTILP